MPDYNLPTVTQSGDLRDYTPDPMALVTAEGKLVGTVNPLPIEHAPTTILPEAGGATFFTLPLAGFSNPMYVGGANAADATGFDISDCAAIVFSVDNGPSFNFTVEQTLDPTGLAGWVPVSAKQVTSLTTLPAATVGTAVMGHWVEAFGVRMRFRVTALTVANLITRVGKLDYIPDMSTGEIRATSAIAEDAAATTTSAVGIALEARSTQKAAMSATGDVVRAQADLTGRQVVKLNSIPETEWNYAAPASGSIVNVATDVVMKTAAGAGIRNYMTNIHISHGTLTAAGELVIKSNATVIHRILLQQTATEGFDIQFPTPKKSGANEPFNVQTPVALGGAIYVNAEGYTSVT